MSCLECIAYQYGVTASPRVFLRLLINFDARYERSEHFMSNLFQFDVSLRLFNEVKHVFLL